MNVLIHADSMLLNHVGDETVNLIVTSPPYYNAIDYGVDCESQDKSVNYRTRDSMEYGSYLEQMAGHFKGWHRALIPGGFACVVVGTILENRRHFPLPYDFDRLLQESGFDFHQDIIWHKVTGGVKRARVCIQHPYPGYYYPNIMTEYILVMRKPGPPIYERVGRQLCNRIPLDDLFKKEIANNVWHVAPVPPNQYDHPCPFPEEIPRRLIQLYSCVGDVVLDPFNGIGTTTKVAKNMFRQYIGYEMMEKYHETALRRLSEPMPGRKNLYAKWEHVDDKKSF